MYIIMLLAYVRIIHNIGVFQSVQTVRFSGQFVHLKVRKNIDFSRNFMARIVWHITRHITISVIKKLTSCTSY